MSNTIDITWLGMATALVLVVIPIIFLYRYRTGLVKPTVIAVLRMGVQLFLIGFYLKYIFLWNYWWLNLLWVIVMSGVAAGTVLKRTQLPKQILLAPVMIAFLISVLCLVGYLIAFVLKANPVWQARYLIPISGMLLGNLLKDNVVALNTFYGGIERERQLYLYNLANGATLAEARAPFMRQALKKAFNPVIASMAVMGLISMPGTMTGQILGGSSPDVAIKYQIVLMITIFSSSLISVMLTLFMANRSAFDAFGLKRF